MGTYRELADDLMFDLAAAVYRGDLPAAEAALDLMHFTLGERTGQTIRRARRQVRPLAPATRLATPDVLPRPGHLPGSMEGSPILAGKRRRRR